MEFNLQIGEFKDEIITQMTGERTERNMGNTNSRSISHSTNIH